MLIDKYKKKRNMKIKKLKKEKKEKVKWHFLAKNLFI